MANKKVSIDFQSKGIKNIIQEIDNLKVKAKEVVFTQELDDQISNLGESARNVKEALDAINEALDETNNKKQDNKTLSNMEAKIKALDEGIKALGKALSGVSTSIDTSVTKISNAIDKINRPDSFSGLLKQMDAVNNAFGVLLDNTTNFKKEIFTKEDIPLAKAADKITAPASKGKGRPKGPDYDSDKLIARLNEYRTEAQREIETIEIDKSLNQEQYFHTVSELAESYNSALKERNELAEKILAMDKQLKTMDQSSQEYAQLKEERRELRASEISLQKTLLKLGSAYDKYVNYTSEYESDSYNGKIATLEDTELFRAISNLNVNDFSDWKHYKPADKDDYVKIIWDGIKTYNKSLLTAIQKRKDQIKEEAKQPEVDYEPSVADSVDKIFSEATAAMETRGRPKKDVQIGIQIKEGAKAEAIASLNQIIEEINATNPHIDINLNLVSDYIMKNRESLVSQLNEQLKKMPDGEAKAEVEKLIPKIDKTFKGDIKLNIATNIPELAEEVPAAVRVIQREVSNIPIDLHLKVNEEDIRKQVEKMGKLSIPIGEITLSKNLYKNIVNEADKASKEEIEAQKKQAALDIKKAKEEGKDAQAVEAKAQKELEEATKAREESVGITLNNTLAKFMSDISKLPTVIRGIYEKIDKIPLEVEVHFNPEQIQEALNEVDGLTLKVAKIDTSKAVLDKLKFDVKDTMQELVPIGKSLVIEVMRLCNVLSPFQNRLKAIASENLEEGEKPQASSVPADIATYIRDGLTVLISLVGDIQGSLSKLENITVTVDKTAISDIQQTDEEKTNAYDRQLAEIYEAIAAVVRALHLINQRLIPASKQTKVDEQSSATASDNSTKVETLLSDIKTNVESISSFVNNIKTYDETSKDTSGVKEIVVGIGTELDDISNRVKEIKESIPETDESKPDSHYEWVEKVISSIEDLRDTIGAKIDGLTPEQIEDTSVHGEEGETVQDYISALIRRLELVRKQLSGLGAQFTHLLEVVSTEQTLSAINGKILGNINPTPQQGQSGTGGKKSGTKASPAATERRQMRKQIQGMLQRQNNRGEQYYTDNYLAQLQTYEAQLAANGGNRKNIRQFLSQSVANVRGDLGQLQNISTEVNNLLSDLDLTNEMRTQLGNIDNSIQTFQQVGEITSTELMQIKSDLSNVKSQRNSADYKLIQELRKASSKRGKYGLFYTDEVVNQLGLLRNDILQNPNNQQIQTNVRNYLDQLPMVGNTRSAGSKLQSYISKGEKLLSTGYLTRGTADQIENVVRQMRNLSNATDVSDKTIGDLVAQFKNLEAEANRTGKTLWGQVGQRLQDMNAKFFATFLSFNDLVRYGRNVIGVMTDLDTALTEMRKVSDESLESLREYQQVTFETAGALGTTAVQLQQTTADWLRLGESMDEASESAKSAITLMNVSEFENINEATTALVAMSQAYKDLDKTEIIDVMNNIGNNYAIATDQLATALQASASALMTQGNDLYEAAALVTAGNQVVQDATKVGTGLRTISLRIAGVKEGDETIKEELAELGEEVDDWVVATQAKKRQVIMDYTRTATNGGQGVDILDSNGNLKDTYHILLEISKVYEQIQKEDKKYGTNRAQGLVEELAGKNRSNIAASILMNPQLLEDVYNSAIDSAGSAAEENAKYLDSIVGKTQQLTNEWQQLQSNLINSDDYKSFLEILTSLLNVVNKFNKALPLITASLVSFSAAMANRRSGMIDFFSYDAQNNSLNGIMPNMGMGNLFGFRDNIQARLQAIPNQGIQFNDQVQQIIREYDQARQAITTSVNDWINSNFDFSQDVLDSANSLIDSGIDNVEAYSEAMQETEIATQEATESISASVATMNTVTTGMIMMLVSAVFMGISKIRTYYRELEESARSVREQIKEVKDEMRDNGKFVQDVAEEYAELKKEVDGLGNNISLSNAEFDRYNEIANEIASRFPELIQGWTDEGNAIIDVKDSVESLNEAYEKHNRIKLAEAADEKNIETTAKDLLNFENQGYWEQLISTISSFYGGGKAHRSKTGYGISYDEQQRLLETVANMSLEEIDRLAKEESYHTSKEGRDIYKYFGQKYFKYVTDSEGVNEVQIDPEAWAQIQSQARSELEQVNAKLEEKLDAFRESIKVKFNFNLSFDETQLDAETQVMAEQVIDSLDRSYLNVLAKDTDKMNAFTEDLIDAMGEMDTDALMALYGFKSEDVNYKEAEDQLMESWNIIYDSFREQIDKAVTQDEKDNLTRILQGIWDSSGMAEFTAKDDTFQNNIANVISNTVDADDIKRLEEYTKDFSIANMDAWNNSVKATMDAKEAIEAYESQLESVKETTASYANIAALLSQDNPIREWDRERIDPDKAEALYNMYDEELKKAEEAGADLERTIYGNIDLNNRGRLDWDEDLLEQYRDEIESWYKLPGDYQNAFEEGYQKALKKYDGLPVPEDVKEEMAKKDADEYATNFVDEFASEMADKYLGTTSTVIGSYDSSSFGGIGIAYSPLLQVDGKSVPLNKETITKYFNEIQNALNAQNLKPTKENILKLDAKGFEVDGQKISNIIADIGETAEHTSYTMHYLGTDGALGLIQQMIDEVEYDAPTWEKVREDLIGLAQSGKLDEKTFRDYKYFDEIIKALGLTADVTDEEIKGMIDSIQKMSTMNAVDRLSSAKTELDKLNNAYEQFQNGGKVDATALNEVQDAFAYLGESYRDFEEAVMTGQEDLQPYFDEMVTQFAIQEGLLQNLDEDTRQWTIDNLVNAGVTRKSAEASVDAIIENNRLLEERLLNDARRINTLADLDDETRRYIEGLEDLDNLDAQNIANLINETEATQGLSDELKVAARDLGIFALQKAIAEGKDLRNPDDLDYLWDLIKACGLGAEALAEFEAAKAAASSLDAQQKDVEAEISGYVDKMKKKYGTEDSTKWDYNDQSFYKTLLGKQTNIDRRREENADYIGNWASNLANEYGEDIMDEVADAWAGMDPAQDTKLVYGGAVEDTSKAAEDAAREAKETLEKILAMYDAELDAGVITFQQYVDKSREAIEQYYRDGKIKASEYYDYLASLYEKQVSEYDKVISAVQRKLQEQTDELEKQKEAIEESYNLQIEEIQNKIDALQDENDEIEKNIALQKAQYELARARNQRTKLMYSESRGFYYEADLKGIQDAEENVRKAQLDKTVSDLQKKITQLQTEMKRETDTIDEQIKKLQEYSEEWGKVSTQLQNSIEDQRAAEILGQNWEQEILDMRIDTLKNFTDEYIALQKAQKDAYLEARRAELDEIETSGGGGSNTKDTTTIKKKTTTDDTKKTKSGGEYSNPTADKAKVGKGYKYNGKPYATLTEAQAAKQADVNGAYQTAYDKEYAKWKNKPIPESVKTTYADNAGKKARDAANKKQIVALFQGSDSAKAGNALVGELGSEIVLDKKTGTASIVEEPTIMKMKGGERVFNADETEKILKSKYVPLKQFNPKKFAMLHAFASGTSSPMQSAIAAQAVGIANGLSKGLIPTAATGGQTINQTFNVSLPNITDASKASDLFREFEQLQRKATQYFN